MRHTSPLCLPSPSLLILTRAPDADPLLEVLRTGCFKYFELGGACVREPVSLLAGIEQAPFLLFRHFFTVAFYSIWVLFTHPRRVGTREDGKAVLRRPRPDEWPLLAVRSVQVVS